MLSCTKLRAKPVVEVTSCEPHIVAKAFTTLEQMCVLSGLCKALFSVAYKHCPDCGAENPKFEAEALTWFGPGKKPGWVKSSLAAKKLGLFVSGLFDSGAFKNTRTV